MAEYSRLKDEHPGHPGNEKRGFYLDVIQEEINVMPTVISLINLKGGVAKTTTTVQLADYLSTIRHERVLVIDLDPQANATESLLGRQRALAITPDDETPTGGPENLNISQCFFSYLEETYDFDVRKILCEDTSNLVEGIGPDLLPASLKLLDVQDRLAEIAQKTGYMLSPVEVLKFALSPILEDYDFVLIDCPPSLNLMTRNALEISDFYLVPVINDPLSTRGLYQILKHIEDYAKIRHWKIECIGVLITKYRSLNDRTFRQERSRLNLFVQRRCESIGVKAPHVFEAYMPESVGVSRAMDIATDSTSGKAFKVSFKEKYKLEVGETPYKQRLWNWIRDIAEELVREVKKRNA
jgi:chromosome partitioning protein